MEQILENFKQRYITRKDEKSLLLYASKLIKFKEYNEAKNVIEDYNNFENIAIVLCYVQSLRYLFEIDKAEEIIKKYCTKEYTNEEYSKLYYELYQIENTKVINMKNRIKKESRSFNEEEKLLKKDYEQKGKEYLKESIKYDKNLYSYLSLANNEFFDSNFEEALKYYQIIINEFNDKEKVNFAYIQIAKIYIQFDKYEEALKILTEREDKNNPLYNQIILNIGYTYMGLKEYTKADNYLKKAIPTIKYPRYEYYAYAKNLYYLNRFEQALLFLNKVINHPKKDIHYYKSLQFSAKIHEELGHYDESFKLYSMMLDGSFKDKQIANLKIGSYYRKKGEYEKAIEYYEKLLNGNNADKAMAYIEMSKVYRITGDLKNEAICIDKTLEQNYGETGKIEKAVYLRRTGQKVEAEEMLLNMINDNKKDTNFAIIELARLYFYSGKTEKAYEYCNMIPKEDQKNYNRAIQFKIKMALISNDKTELTTLLNEIKDIENTIDKSFYNLVLGNLAFEDGDYELALDYYDLVTSVENKAEKIARTAYIYAIGYKDMNKAKELLDELENSDKSLKGYVLNTKIKILINANKLEEATNLYIQNSDNNIVYKNNIIELAKKYDENGNLDASANIYNIALNKTNDPYYYYKIGDLYNRYREYDKAEYWLNIIIDNNMNNKNHAILKLVRIYIMKKEYDKAYSYIKKLEGTKLECHAKMEMAIICLDNGKTKEAKEIYESMLETENRNFALYQLAKLARINKEHEIGLGYIEELLKNPTKEDETLAMLEKARIFSSKNMNDEANSIYIELINRLNSDEKCRKYIELDDIDYLDNETYFYTEEEQSMVYSILLEKARLEKKMGNNEEAIKYYSMIKEGYERFFAVCDIVEIYLDENKITKAEEIVETIHSSNYLDRYNFLKCKIERAKGNYGLAREYLNKVQKEEFNLEKQYLDAILCSCENKEEEAIEIFKKLSKETGMYKMMACYQLAHYYLAKLDKTNARYYLEILEQNGNKEAVSNLINLDIRDKNYLSALKRNDSLYKDASFQQTTINNYNLISKELNVAFPKEHYGISSYKREQIDEYDENKAISYVEYNNTDTEHCTPFNKSVDIPLLFEIIGDVLIPENLSRIGSFDEYIIPFKNAGEHGENYIKVLTIPNTKNIITMYPVNFEDIKNYKIR